MLKVVNLIDDIITNNPGLFEMLILVLLIITMYNKIKFLCLEMAAEKVAQIEEDKELTGPEKFALVVKWINDSLPVIFRNALIKVFVEKLVQYVYDNCSMYTKNYIKRKTGKELTEVLKEVGEREEDT